MAKDDTAPVQSPEESDAPSSRTDATTAEAAAVPQDTRAQNKKRTLPKLSGAKWAVVIVVGFFAILGICASSAAVLKLVSHTDDTAKTGQTYSARDTRLYGDENLGQSGGSMRGGMPGFGDRSFNDSNTSTRVSGVVTAVDGDTITVAGNGTTTKVVVTSDTTYSGSEKPAAVNDTIMVTGTKDSDTFTATTVRLMRQSS